MADTASKRPNTGGKAAVATPNVGSAPGMVSLEAALNGSIGARIRIQTTPPAPVTLEGTLFTLCPLTSLLVLLTTTSTNPQKTHIIPLSALTTFTILSPPPSTTTATTNITTPLPPLKTSPLLARATAALTAAKEKASRTNKDVSKEAQDIFDALYKQFPGTRWAGKDMVVLDTVLVKGPGYRGEDVKANKEGEGAAGRVRKVLENERHRMARRDTKPASVKPVIPAIPAIPAFQARERKGG